MRTLLYYLGVLVLVTLIVLILAVWAGVILVAAWSAFWPALAIGVRAS